jgi:hypothetical protein
LTDLPSREGLNFRPSPLRGEGEGEGVFIVHKQTLVRVILVHRKCGILVLSALRK